MSFPLSAVVGMDDLRLALLLNAVSPTLGGVLVRGEKGTAKSTAVRGLAALLPPVEVVEGCRFSCAPDAPSPDCPDGPHPPGGAGLSRPARLVELPVGASEDRVTGSLDLDRALADGVSVLRPGLLAAAHRGLLYVDEVNLLGDHLVDLLLDAAAMGVAQVERDGVSVRHPAAFLLVGTMNPEEGELRPQLLDRFGLTVQVAASRDPRERGEVVRRRLAFEADPAGFAATWAGAEAALAAQVAAARGRLAGVRLSDAALGAVTTVCAACDVDGMRADVILAKTAMALAAWSDRATVLAADIRVAARLVLPHRRRRGPFDAPGMDDATLDAALDEALAGLDEEVARESAQERAPADRPGQSAAGEGEGEGDGPDEDPPGGDGPRGGGRGGAGDDDAGGDGVDDRGAGGADAGGGAGGRESEDDGSSDSPDRTGAPLVAPDGVPVGHGGPAGPGAGDSGGAGSVDERDPDGTGQAAAGPTPGTGLAGAPTGAFRPRLLTVAGLAGSSGTAGRRSPARGTRGAVVTTAADIPGLHLPATLRAAAPFQAARGRSGPGLVLTAADRRGPVRVGREGNLVLFVVDASGSMAARARMTLVTTAVLSLLVDAYQRRDRIGMITFRGSGAEVVLAPTSSVEVGAARLAALPTGGRTPIVAGLARAGEVLRAERRRDPTRRALLIVVTDGRATAGGDPLAAARALVRSAGGAATPGARGNGGRTAGLTSVVVDCENGFIRLGLAGRLATALGGVTIPLDALPRMVPAVSGRAPAAPGHPPAVRPGPGLDRRSGKVA